jgi:diguanylate cyclase (GGDEF)-like protein
MRKSVRAGSGWRFSFSVLIPVVVAVAVTLGTAAAFIVWSTTKSNERALERQTRLVSHILEQSQEAIGAELMDITLWDDAVEALDSADWDWVDESLGANFYGLFGHSRIYVLGPDLQPIYAMRDGGKADISSFEADREVLGALAAHHRTVEGASAIAAHNNGFGEVPVVRDIAVVEGRAAIVGAVPILAESYVVPAGEEHFEVAVRFLDDAVADELMQQYLIEGARFDSDSTTAEGESTLPLRNAAGETVAWFKWRPDAPGAQILAETAPAMGIVLLAAALIIFLLMQRLRRSSAELEAARAEAQHRALHDPLTGLANRAGFGEAMEQAARSLAGGKGPVALLMLDLDKFKQVNDTLGHEAGDLLLQQVAQRLKPLLRDTDLLARLGGDEFAIVQSAVTAPNDARALSERIVSRIAEPFNLEGSDARIGVSVGIAIAHDATDAAELPARADFALYEAKDAGRNQYRMFGDRDGGGDIIQMPRAANANRVA